MVEAEITARRPDPIHVSLVALPDAVVSTLSGIFDVLNFTASVIDSGGTSAPPPFQVEIVGEATGPLELASGIPIHVQREIDQVDTTDVVIVPSVLLPASGWQTGRYARLVEWLVAMHGSGAALCSACSACSGLFLLAETELFNRKDATLHYGYAQEFAKVFPKVPIHPERVLVIAGRREELISSGASMTWHDMVLYLIARHAGPTTAHAVARFFALQWHQDGLTPYIIFEGRTDHGDEAIKKAQDWLSRNFSVAHVIEETTKRTNLAERTFKRRFTNATGLSPIAYVQRLRVEAAKRRLERANVSIDEISWKVGYEDAAFFRRLFKRTVGLTPGMYRKRFSLPTFVD